MYFYLLGVVIRQQWCALLPLFVFNVGVLVLFSYIFVWSERDLFMYLLLSQHWTFSIVVQVMTRVLEQTI